MFTRLKCASGGYQLPYWLGCCKEAEHGDSASHERASAGQGSPRQHSWSRNWNNWHLNGPIAYVNLQRHREIKPPLSTSVWSPIPVRYLGPCV